MIFINWGGAEVDAVMRCKKGQNNAGRVGAGGNATNELLYAILCHLQRNNARNISMVYTCTQRIILRTAKKKET